jgi:hypothetical protein
MFLIPALGGELHAIAMEWMDIESGLIVGGFVY